MAASPTRNGADALLTALAHRVRALRAERGLTLQRLARKARLSPRFLVQVEQGGANISVASWPAWPPRSTRLPPPCWRSRCRPAAAGPRCPWWRSWG